jgi:vacuolar-type H+-ATPase catalytic subunit A/Vma1
MSAKGSKFWGVVTTLALTGGGLLFLVAVMEESHTVHDPTPVFVSIAAAAIYFALLRGPVGRAIGKMLESSSGSDDQLTERIEQLEDRVAELSNDQHNVAELEERLDFAERLLAQRGDAPTLRSPEPR